MEQFMIQEAIDRIRQMEQNFDKLQKAVNINPAAILENASLNELLQNLTQYYESGQWLHDYELDEKGLLPQSLKRGVLAQDAVYDLLDRYTGLGR